ncbi:2-amino-4-hydroxy-6-hydroxymethyldihydropteridine diphosphokinase [Silvibacterium acidisoli]|uniref:2-amino-4-hydroxy-6- hydroxymethyldihydropteridine diphosphokinase n=1 Tax=Acidobacteriaceae bacterium ZG23-2 TaxID=2883246 RepID=UPI00406CAE4E
MQSARLKLRTDAEQAARLFFLLKGILNGIMPVTAYIGIGSNVASSTGTPEETVRAAFAALERLGRVMAVSSLYKTAPVGDIDQPAFINAVAAVETELEPEAILSELLSIERSFGRDRAKALPKGPRTLDLDLLLVDAVILQTDTLTLPHPELARRRFVLTPLAEIAPFATHPVFGITMSELLRELPGDGPNAPDAVVLVP